MKRFDPRSEIQAWFWFISAGAKDEFLDANLMVDARGKLTPNGLTVARAGSGPASRPGSNPSQGKKTGRRPPAGLSSMLPSGHAVSRSATCRRR